MGRGIRDAFGAHQGLIRRASGAHSARIRDAFGAHQGRMRRASGTHAARIRDAFGAHQGRMAFNRSKPADLRVAIEPQHQMVHICCEGA